MTHEKMMEVLINGHPLTLLSPPATYGELIRVISSHADYKALVITQILCDGQTIDFPDVEAPLDCARQPGQRLDIVMEEPARILMKSVEDGLTLINLLREQLLVCIEQFRLGHMPEGNHQFGMILEKISLFMDFFEEIGKFTDQFFTAGSASPRIGRMKGQLVDLLREIMASQEKHDFVLLADLLEFELPELLGEGQEILSSLAPAEQ